MDSKVEAFLAAVRGAYGEAGESAAKALEWTRARHGDARRASGEPAWEHDLRVASILLEMGMDLDSVVAALVHDVSEAQFDSAAHTAVPGTAGGPAGARAGAGAIPEKDAAHGGAAVPEASGAPVGGPAGLSGAAAGPAGTGPARMDQAPAATPAAGEGAAPGAPGKAAQEKPGRGPNPGSVHGPDPRKKPGARDKDRELEARRKALSAVPDADIASRFGEGAARIVAGVARLASVRAKNKTVQAAETMRKMLFAMTGDIRVIIVKLADKLDSMRTLKSLPEDRQKSIASECLDVFAPLADRLGISWLKDELEDLSLKYVNREAYDQIKEIVAAKKGERERYLARVTADIKAEAAKEGIGVDISARAKHFYSIYMKMRKKSKGVEELYDLLGLRLICESDNDCYALLGMVHRLWKPIDGRFKDYIAMPKANGYRSLHSTVMCYDGRLLEVQIRTKLMHSVAEYGVASHWLYKKGSTAERPRLEDLPIVNRLKQWNDFLAQGAEYLDEIKRELLGDSIFVFTPQGDVIELPAGATAIDFAFAIHTDVGGHCLGAKADGAIIPLDAELRNTQVVEILTSPQAKPNLNWLKLARTSKARNKIRAWLVQSGQVLAIDKNIVAGKKPEKVDEKAREAAQAEEARKLAALREAAAREPHRAPEAAHADMEYRSLKPGQELRNEKAGVAVGGARNMMIRIAGCCKPATGDPIVGYVSRGRGIIVHRADCHSVLAIADFAQRRIEVRWEDSSSTRTARFRVTAKRAADIFSEIEAAVHKFNGRLREGKLGERGDGTLSGFFTMEMESRDDQKKVVKALRGLPAILSLEED